MSAEKTYKNFANSVTTIINTGISVLKILFLSKFGVQLPQTKEETCIVLGNGPSLKTSFQKHIEKIGKHKLFCVNSFATTNEYTLLKPSYYVMLDHSFWKSEHETIINTFEAIVTKTTWDVQLFVPRMAKKTKRFDELASKNKHIHLTYFNYTVFKGADSVANFFYSKNLAMPQAQNVLVASIFLAINVGFKRIIVLGADHTWHQTLSVNMKNQVCVNLYHFNENKSETPDVLFYKNSKDLYKMYEIFLDWSKMFLGYNNVELYSKKRNSKIFNASEISCIDAFERVTL